MAEKSKGTSTGTKDDEKQEGTPAWMVTYGDMVTLLLTFFIMLSINTEEPVDERRVAVVESIVRAFGGEGKISDDWKYMNLPRHSQKTGRSDIPAEKIDDYRSAAQGDEDPPGKHVKRVMVKDGERQRIGAVLRFEPGLADLTATAKIELEGIAVKLKGKQHMIEVRAVQPVGSRLPASSKYKTDPHRLAFARARAMTEFLVAECSVDRDGVRTVIAAPDELSLLEGTSGGGFESPDNLADVSILESSMEKFESDTNSAP